LCTPPIRHGPRSLLILLRAVVAILTPICLGRDYGCYSSQQNPKTLVHLNFVVDQTFAFVCR
jgi:hypothetical protein